MDANGNFLFFACPTWEVEAALAAADEEEEEEEKGWERVVVVMVAVGEIKAEDCGET